MVVHKYGLIKYTNFNKFKYYYLFYKLFMYTQIKPLLPVSLNILSEPFRDDDSFVMDAATIYD